METSEVQETPPVNPVPPSDSARRRGRPLEMSREELLARIRAWSESGQLFRVHLEWPAIYARARRLYGTWAKALEAAGLDHARALVEARRRGLEHRRKLHRKPPRTSR